MRIGLFMRRISRAIKFDRESMGQTSSRGHRRDMEDVCVVIPELNELDAFFAVYDGRNGNLAAECAAKRLHREMVRHKHFADDPAVAMEVGCRHPRSPSFSFSLLPPTDLASTAVLPPKSPGGV